MPRIALSILLIAVLITGGVSVQQWLVATAPSPARIDSTRPPLRVEGIVVQPRTVREPIVGFGTVAAMRTAGVAAQVAGEVVERADQLRVGASVLQGDVLLKIDDREYRQQWQRARSQIEFDEAVLTRLDVEAQNLQRLIDIAGNEQDIAEREYQRVLTLFEASQAPRRELDLARRLYEEARRGLQTLANSKALIPQQRAAQAATRDVHAAEAAIAELNLERCTIVAPFDGQLARVEVEIGEQVAPGRQLFELLDPDRLEIPIELPVSLADRVEVGSPVTLRLESRRDTTWRARVTRIAPSASTQTRTLAIYVQVAADQRPSLLPGMFVHAQIAGPLFRDALIVPRAAVYNGSVFIARDGVAMSRLVDSPRHLLDQTVVTGLAAGDTVIISNLDTVFDGCPVRVTVTAPESTLPDASGYAPTVDGGASGRS
jgi:HlyD family secretion protein